MVEVPWPSGLFTWKQASHSLAVLETAMLAETTAHYFLATDKA